MLGEKRRVCGCGQGGLGASIFHRVRKDGMSVTVSLLLMARDRIPPRCTKGTGRDNWIATVISIGMLLFQACHQVSVPRCRGWRLRGRRRRMRPWMPQESVCTRTPDSCGHRLEWDASEKDRGRSTCPKSGKDAKSNNARVHAWLWSAVIKCAACVLSEIARDS